MMDLAREKLGHISSDLPEMMHVNFEEITNEKIDEYIEKLKNNPLAVLFGEDDVLCAIESLNDLRRYVRDEKEESLDDLLARLDKIEDDDEKKRTM